VTNVSEFVEVKLSLKSDICNCFSLEELASRIELSVSNGSGEHTMDVF